MHPRATEFARRARETYDFDPDVHEFDEGARTAADAADAVGCAVDQIASSLVFVADGDPVVVVTSGANRVSESQLAARVGVPAGSVRMADPEEVRATTGWAIGGVPPFCHDGDPRVLFDESLDDHGTVWAAAGTPEALFPVSPSDLRRYADAELADVAE